MASSGASPTYRFSFGPWNISTGADPFGPPVRRELEFARKIKAYKELGFDAVQFHDDDIVPADLDWPATLKGVAAVKSMLDGEGLFVEIIAPRLWEDPRTIDGGFTANSPADRRYALDRARRTVDIAREVGCKNYVLWLAREGSATSARPRTRRPQSPGSSMPGTRSSSTTKRSVSWARPSRTERWTRLTSRRWDYMIGVGLF